MTIDVNSTTPIYIQVAEMIENMILEGSILEGDQVPSTTQLSQFYSLNPATIRKGFNILLDSEIIFKKRGLGMFVKEGANQLIKNRRKDSFYNEFILTMLNEGKKIGIEQEDIIDMILQHGEVTRNG